MSHVADRLTAILDANVLYPFRMRDILLSFYAKGLFRARWTDEIVGEWRRNLLRDRPGIELSIDKQIVIMRSVFDDAWVTGHEALIEGLELPDRDDRHVLAAAVRCGAHQIVTNNLKDFPLDALERFGLTAVSADQFLARLFELYPDDAGQVLNAVRSRYENPAFTPEEFIQDMMARGLPLLACAARRHPLENGVSGRSSVDSRFRGNDDAN